MTKTERDALLRRMLKLFKDDIEQSPNPARTEFLLQVLLGFLDRDVIVQTAGGDTERKTSDEEIIARCERAQELKKQGRALQEIMREGLLSPAHR